MVLIENVRVVVVEDNEMTRLLIVDMLEMFLNREVESFENGRDAWEHIRSNPVDMVISDINMPRMSGLELLAKIKSEFPDIIFICMSGNGMEIRSYIEEARQFQAEHFLVKPFSVKDFIRIVEKYIVGETG